LFRCTLGTVDADDVGTGTRTTGRWLRVGDELEVGGPRWRVVDRLLAPEVEGLV